MWKALDLAARPGQVPPRSEVQAEPVGLASTGGNGLPAISAVVSSLRAMVSAAPAKRGRSPSTTRKRKKKSQEERHSQKSSQEESTKKKKKRKKKTTKYEERRQKRATKAATKEKEKEEKRKETRKCPKPAEHEEPSFGEVVSNNEQLEPQVQDIELSETAMALMESSEPLDGDMWEEVDESVLLQDFLEADPWPGDESSLLPSDAGDSGGTQEVLTANSLETDRKPVVASVAATAGSSQAEPRPKRKAAQRFKPHELDTLKAFFHVDPLPSHTARKTLASQMGASTERITTWFQRARYNQRRSQRLKLSTQSGAATAKAENYDGDGSLTEARTQKAPLAETTTHL